MPERFIPPDPEEMKACEMLEEAILTLLKKAGSLPEVGKATVTITVTVENGKIAKVAPDRN